MSGEAVDGGIIPNYVVSFFDFQRERKLRAEDLFDQGVGEPTLFAQPATLGGRRTGNRHRPINVRFRTCLKQERNIDEEPSVFPSVLLRKCQPSRADRGMQDRLKLKTVLRIREHQIAKAHSIRLSSLIANSCTKGVNHRSTDFFILREKFSRAPIGIKKRGGQVLKERSCERGFSGRDPTGDAEDGHGSLRWLMSRTHKHADVVS